MHHMTDFMTRVEAAIHADLGHDIHPSPIRVLAVVPKERREREGWWEWSFVVAFERHHSADSARPHPVDYGSIVVHIDSRGEHLCHTGWYDRTTPTQALADMLGRAQLADMIA